ncbi:unnamed protein product [Orchesella dallaii]|uniref:CCHC-type domain-containing protein n=1 Tax=Orchesella dallaii TaxID=48710 RepID=A0ABP1Q5I9_9HEXA
MNNTPVVTYEQLLGEHMQVYAYRVLLAIKENTGMEIPDDRLFRHIVPGIHPSISKLLTYPPPLTLAQLFSWYETAIDKLERDDPFLMATTTPVTGVAPSAAEEQEHDLIVRENDNATCYRCGTMGHYAAFCDRKRVNSLRGKRKNKKRRTHRCTQGTTNFVPGVYKGRVEKKKV